MEANLGCRATNGITRAALYASVRDYLSRQQATLSELLTVSSLSDELSLAQVPMTDSQREQLTQIMYEERTAIPAPNVDNFSTNSRVAQRALEDWEAALEQRVQDRASGILSSAQQTRYEQFMTRQREARNAFASFDVAQSRDNGGVSVTTGLTPPLTCLRFSFGGARRN
jgi:hypothetical protein